MDQFQETLEYCQLHDLGLEWEVFTWRNHNHIAAEYIRERLDRAVANAEWMVKFPGYRVINGDPRHSDHRPVIISTERPAGRRSGAGRNGFKFEASWLGEVKCGVVVEEAWKRAMNGQ